MSDRILNMNEILDITNRSRATIYKWMKKGHFPQRCKSRGKTLGWWESDVEKWKNETKEGVEYG